jgi:regulator of PEP synthase PpsR (kinase-PPPase family)
MKRSVFFISDHTGITAEALGRALISQFDGFQFDTVHWPFVDNMEKALRAVERINRAAHEDGVRPLVFSTLVEPAIRACFKDCGALMFDFFEAHTSALEQELGMSASRAHGRFHGMGNRHAYRQRIDAVNFALNNDDGATTVNYHSSDLILVGVSRSGKTPTCLYLGLQYGILAANYPLTEDDMDSMRLPPSLHMHREKLFGLKIEPEQLQRIRRERRPQGRYSSLAQCRREVEAANSLYRHFNIPHVDTTSMSIEEIAATILQKTGLESRIGR